MAKDQGENFSPEEIAIIRAAQQEAIEETGVNWREIKRKDCAS